MAVQQNKKSPSKRGMHRSHDALTAPALSIDSATGEYTARTTFHPTACTAAVKW